MGTGKSAFGFPLPRVAVEGTVVSAEDGRPVGGARVRYLFDPEDEYGPGRGSEPHPMLGAPPVRTDRRGRFRLRGIPYWPGGYRKVVVEKPGFFPSSRPVEFEREGETRRIGVALRRAPVIRGICRKDDGSPIAGVELTVIVWSGRTSEDSWEAHRFPCFHLERHARLETRTDGRGRYTLSPVPSEKHLSLHAKWPWGVGALQDANDRVQPGVLELRRDFVFQPAGCVAVTLSKGTAPTPDSANVELRQRRKRSHPGMTFSNLRDWIGEGTSTVLSGVAAGKHVLRVRALCGDAPGAELRVPIVVRKGKTTRVRTTIPSGRVRRPWKDGEDPHLRPMLMSPEYSGPTASAVGRVLDRSTGRPLVAARVYDLWSPSNEDLEESRFHSLLAAPPATTDGRGRFRLAGIRLTAGQPRKILVAATGYWTTARVYAFDREDEERRFEFRLRPAGFLRGTVRDPEGRPLEGAQVMATTQGNRSADADWKERFRYPSSDLGRHATATATTDVAGRYVLSPLPLGAWLDLSASMGCASAIPDALCLYLRDHERDRVLDFVIEPGGLLSVTAEGIPAGDRPHLTIEVRRSDGSLAVSSTWTPTRRHDPADPEPEPERTMNFEGLAPGVYLLSLKGRGIRRRPPVRAHVRRGAGTAVTLRASRA